MHSRRSRSPRRSPQSSPRRRSRSPRRSPQSSPRRSRSPRRSPQSSPRRRSRSPRRSSPRRSSPRRSSSRAPPMIRHRRRLSENIQGFKNPQIKRISLKAGVGKISGQVYDAVKKYIKVFTHDMVKNAVIYTQHARRKTINTQDILDSFERTTSGHKLYGAEQAQDSCKPYDKKKGNSTQETYIKRQIVHYQRQHDCFYFTKVAVDRFLKEITQDYDVNMRWTAEAKIAAQAAIENYILQLLQKAGMIAHTNKKVTVSETEIYLAARLCGKFNINNPVDKFN